MRNVNFVVQCQGSEGSVACYRVSPHRRLPDWAKLLGEAKRMGGDIDIQRKLVLVEEGNSVMNVLSKLEPRATGPNAVIHTFLEPDGALLIELPRFGIQLAVDRSWSQQDNTRSAIRCANYRGCYLAHAQQLPDTLAELTRYLVLVPESEGEAIKVIVPQGRVVVREGVVPSVWIECENEDQDDAELNLLCYTLHGRWGQLVAEGIFGRLQLAAMFSATGTLLPDIRAGMAGSEKAMELVRRCMVNHPLQDSDKKQLSSIIELSGLNPALALLCGDLLASSTELIFLHCLKPQAAVPPALGDVLDDASTAYQGECAALEWNRRRRLTATEEIRVLGGRGGGLRVLPGHGRALPAYGSVVLPNCPVSAAEVAAVEVELWNMKDILVSTGSNENKGHMCGTAGETMQPYPLRVPRDADILTKEKHAELQTSWRVYQQALPARVQVHPTVLECFRKLFVNKSNDVSLIRQHLEKFLLRALSTFGTDWHATSWHMQRHAALLPTASVEDLPPMLWEKERIRHYNPFLSETASTGIAEAVVSWLRLCVLEDKLDRLKKWSASTRSDALLWQEMQVNYYARYSTRRVVGLNAMLLLIEALRN